MDLEKKLANARLYAIFTEALSALPLEEAIPAAVRGGADIIQIREKGSRARRIELACRALAALAGLPGDAGAGVILIVNDDPEAAVAAGAHGVHLGPEDMDPAAARARLRPGMLLGLSTTTVGDAEAAVKAGADYIGAGTVFPTNTRTGKAVIGPAAAARIAAAAGIPTFPIGGIDRAGARLLAQAGCGRAAVCSALFAGADVAERAAAIRRELERVPLPR